MVRRALLLTAVAAALGSGCGENRADTPVESIPTVAVPVDCTASVRGDQARWPHEIAVLASRTLPRGQALLTGCFFGPKRGVQWLQAFDPRSLPDNVTGGERARRRYAENYGLMLQPVFQRELQPRSKPKGTNWLGALVTSARVPSVDSVWLFSDLVQ